MENKAVRWQRENRERWLAYKREWARENRKKNPEKYEAIKAANRSRNRHAREQKRLTKIIEEDRLEESREGYCQACGIFLYGQFGYCKDHKNYARRTTTQVRKDCRESMEAVPS